MDFFASNGMLLLIELLDSCQSTAYHPMIFYNFQAEQTREREREVVASLDVIKNHGMVRISSHKIP
jgi:hypothetical protein